MITNSNSQLGDIEVAPSIDPVNLGVMVLAGLLVAYYAIQDKKHRQVSRKPTSRTTARVGLTGVEKDVIEGLVGQGAKKSEATQAVKQAKANGASGFEGLFRAAIKEL